MGTWKIVLSTVAALGAAAGAGAIAVASIGLYNVSATVQHTQFVYSFLEGAMRQSVRLRARSIEAPPLGDPQQLLRGAMCFQQKCVQCHGAPGVAQNDIGKSMQPLPGPLVDARHHWKPRELYWVTRHGIKMSGMPAWEFRLSDEDLWAVVAFLDQLPDLSPERYREMTVAAAAAPRQAGAFEAAPAADGARCGAADSTDSAKAGSVSRGKLALTQYACNSCHTIPGVTGSSPHVGPPLDGIGERALIAGKLANTPDNMVRWLRHTRAVDPKTAMPEMGVTEQDARDMAAYLATLK